MTQYTINDLIPGQAYAVQVRAKLGEEFSEWSPLVPITTTTTYTGITPLQPTAPVVSTYIQTIRITWLGTWVSGTVSADFDRIEIHMSSTPAFVMSSTTLVRTVKQKSTISITDMAPGTYYVRFRAVNTSGTFGPESAEVSSVSTQITTPVIAASAIADLTSDPIFLQYFGSSDGVSGWSQYAGVGDLLSTEDQTFEGGTVGAWIVAGTVVPTITNDTTHPYSGTKGLKAVWGTAGSFPAVAIDKTNFIAGHTYQVTAQFWVPSGSPDLQWAIAGGSLDTTGISTKNAFVSYTWSFVATNWNHRIAVWPKSAPTAGQGFWMDEVHVTDTTSNLSWFNDTSAPTVPGVLRLQGSCWAEWQGSSPFAYDQQSFYRIRSRMKLTPTELAIDGNFALGTGANWDTYWSGTVTFDFTGFTGKCNNASGSVQNGTLRNGGTASNVVTGGTTIRIRGSVRTNDASSNPYIEMVTSPNAGQAAYFGTGAVANGVSLVNSATLQDFTVDLVVPIGHICYTVYFRNLSLASGFYIEWDNISIKELSSQVQVGMIAYQSDRTTPIQPNNISTSKLNIHNPLVVDASTMGEDWYEFTAYIYDRSADTAGITGLTPNQQNFELGVLTGSWETAVVVNSTAAINTNATYVRSGANSLASTSVAAGTARSFTTPISVVPGKLYSAIARSKGAAGRTVGVGIAWYSDALGSTYLSDSTGTLITDNSTGWTDLIITDYQAPANAVSARVYSNFVALGAGEVHYFDDFDFIGDFSGQMGSTAATAMSLSGQSKYWRPAIILDTKTISGDILDIDWFQIDRVAADLSIPGGLKASAVYADTVTTPIVSVTDTFAYPNISAQDGYVLTSDANGVALWQPPVSEVRISPDGTPPSSMTAGDLWINPARQGSEPQFVTATGPSTVVNLFLGSVYTKISAYGDTKITIPCDGILEIDFYCWIGWTTPSAAAISLGYVDYTVNTAGYASQVDMLFDYWYQSAIAAQSSQRDVRVRRIVRFESVPADGVDISIFVMGYGATSQANTRYPRMYTKFNPYANGTALVMT